MAEIEHEFRYHPEHRHEYGEDHDFEEIWDCFVCYEAEIVKATEDRILKLLESKLTGRDNGLAYCYECGYWDDLYPEVVALIKGEK